MVGIGRWVLVLASVCTPWTVQGAVAERRDPEVARAMAEIRAADEHLRQASAWKLPRVSIAAAWKRSANDGGGRGLPRPFAATTRTLTLALSLRILDEPSRRESEAARFDVLAAQGRADDARLRFELRCAREVLAVWRDREKLTLSRRNERALAALVEEARSRLDVGLAAVTEVYEAVSQHATAVKSVAEAGLAFDDSLVRMSLVGGSSLRTTSVDECCSRTSEPLSTGALPALLEAALRHPRLVALQHDVAAQEYRIAAVRSEHAPLVGFEASYGATRSMATLGGAPAHTRRNRRTTGALKLTIKLRFSSGMGATSRQARAIHKRDASRDALEVMRHDMARKLRAAWLERVASATKLAAARSAVEAATVARDAMIAATAHGAARWSDRLRSESQFATTQIDSAKLRFELAENELILKELIGVP
jgi:outer membrane protein